ncbi:hypothetical protein C8J56DRAFT_1035876 [Mycena floridula]|nr:hypothetical protein C8J56DRAFT_1035876 [Mycena floridula]
MQIDFLPFLLSLSVICLLALLGVISKTVIKSVDAFSAVRITPGILPREHLSRRLQVSGYNDKEPQEILGKTLYPLFRCESSVEILCQGVRQWKNSSIGFSAHNFGGDTRTSAVEGYTFWGQLNSLYESDELRFQVILEVCKRRIDPVIEYDRVHGLLIVKELPYLRAIGRLALLPVSQISSGWGGGVAGCMTFNSESDEKWKHTFDDNVRVFLRPCFSNRSGSAINPPFFHICFTIPNRSPNVDDK